MEPINLLTIGYILLCVVLGLDIKYKMLYHKYEQFKETVEN